MADNEGCLFCRLYESSHEGIMGSEFFWSMFDRFPVSPGHALLIPKRHVVSIADLKLDERKSMMDDISGTLEDIEDIELREVYERMLEEPLEDENLRDKSRAFVERALASPFLGRKPDGYTIGINDGRAAGRTVDHLHVQIIPRFDGDVENPRGGVRNVIPGFGDYT